MKVNYVSIHLDPNWADLWNSPHSFARDEIERLERVLHDPTSDPALITGAQHRLAAFAWLRDGVMERATNPNFREAKDQERQGEGRNGWRRAVVNRLRAAVSRDTVLPSRIG